LSQLSSGPLPSPASVSRLHQSARLRSRCTGSCYSRARGVVGARANSSGAPAALWNRNRTAEDSIFTVIQRSIAVASWALTSTRSTCSGRGGTTMLRVQSIGVSVWMWTIQRACVGCAQAHTPPVLAAIHVPIAQGPRGRAAACAAGGVAARGGKGAQRTRWWRRGGDRVAVQRPS
jgi:hypothetical protein